MKVYLCSSKAWYQVNCTHFDSARIQYQLQFIKTVFKGLLLHPIEMRNKTRLGN